MTVGGCCISGRPIGRGGAERCSSSSRAIRMHNGCTSTSGDALLVAWVSPGIQASAAMRCWLLVDPQCTMTSLAAALAQARRLPRHPAAPAPLQHWGRSTRHSTGAAARTTALGCIAGAAATASRLGSPASCPAARSGAGDAGQVAERQFGIHCASCVRIKTKSADSNTLQ